MVGRRRVGKTALLNEAYQGESALYLFISRKSEPLPWEEFAVQIRTQLGIPIYGQPKQLREIITILFEYAEQNPLMRIFQDSKEPLFGRAAHRLNLQPLKPDYIAELLNDQQRYSPENLLTWYSLSGGVPKYLEWLSQTDTSVELWQERLSEHSLVIEEGKYSLAEEFGSEQSTYFSIFACIASGKTSRSDIESVLEMSVGRYLAPSIIPIVLAK